MKVLLDKFNRVAVDGPITIACKFGMKLVVKLTDCEIDAKSGEVTIRCCKMKISEKVPLQITR